MTKKALSLCKIIPVPCWSWGPVYIYCGCGYGMTPPDLCEYAALSKQSPTESALWLGTYASKGGGGKENMSRT